MPLTSRRAALNPPLPAKISRKIFLLLRMPSPLKGAPSEEGLPIVHPSPGGGYLGALQVLGRPFVPNTGAPSHSLAFSRFH